MEASAWHWRPGRRLPSFRSRVVFLSFSSLTCFCPFHRSSPNLKWSFFKNFLPLVSVVFWGFQNQPLNKREKRLSLATRQSLLLTSKHQFTPYMYTNAFIANDKILSASHLEIGIALRTNKFIASDERVCVLETSTFDAGGERVSCWK